MSKKTKSKKPRPSAPKSRASSALAAGASAAPESRGAPAPAVSAEAEAVASFNRKEAKREARKEAAAKRAPARRKLPNWPVLGVALAGMALTVYLSWTAWAGEKLAYCGTGSSCDIVQSSRWATLLGLPTAFWGLLAYTSVAWIALRVRDTGRHWQAAWLVVLPSVAVSLYLTAVSLLTLQASCIYCLSSLGLWVVLLAVLLAQSRGVSGIAWPGWLSATGGLGVALVVLLHLHYSGVFTKAAGPEDPYLRGLAEHLKTSGAQMYGASWCPHCQEQKEMFGASAERLPYVECSPNGPNQPSAPACVARGVESYPTWFFGEERYTGTLKVDELASRTGYVAAGAPKP